MIFFPFSASRFCPDLTTASGRKASDFRGARRLILENTGQFAAFDRQPEPFRDGHPLLRARQIAS